LGGKSGDAEEPLGTVGGESPGDASLSTEGKERKRVIRGATLRGRPLRTAPMGQDPINIRKKKNQSLVRGRGIRVSNLNHLRGNVLYTVI